MLKNSVTTFFRVSGFGKGHILSLNIEHKSAEIAQWGERQTEDLKVPGSIPGFGSMFIFLLTHKLLLFKFYDNLLVKRPKKPTFLTHFYISTLKNYSISFVSNRDNYDIQNAPFMSNMANSRCSI